MLQCLSVLRSVVACQHLQLSGIALRGFAVLNVLAAPLRTANIRQGPAGAAIARQASSEQGGGGSGSGSGSDGYARLQRFEVRGPAS